MTLVGPDGTCPAARLEPVAGGLRVREACDAVLALDGELPQARLVPLRFEPLRSGRGRAGDGEGWTVRLEYGPLEGGSPGLPGHVQVKRDGAPILRHNTWLRVEAMDLLRIGAVTWLVLRARDAGEAFRLGSRPTERVSW